MSIVCITVSVRINDTDRLFFLLSFSLNLLHTDGHTHTHTHTRTVTFECQESKRLLAPWLIAVPVTTIYDAFVLMFLIRREDLVSADVLSSLFML